MLLLTNDQHSCVLFNVHTTLLATGKLQLLDHTHETRYPLNYYTAAVSKSTQLLKTHLFGNHSALWHLLKAASRNHQQSTQDVSWLQYTSDMSHQLTRQETRDRSDRRDWSQDNCTCWQTYLDLKHVPLWLILRLESLRQEDNDRAGLHVELLLSSTHLKCVHKVVILAQFIC